MRHLAGRLAGANPAPQGVIGDGLDILGITWCNPVAVWLAMSRGKWREGKHTSLPEFNQLSREGFTHLLRIRQGVASCDEHIAGIGRE
jgi:hypothetical protein